jgi:hypothetical protein
MRAENWVARTRRSAAVTDIRSAPSVHASAAMHRGRVGLTLHVTATGLASPDGRVRVWRGQTLVGRFAVTDGVGSRLLKQIAKGTHTLTVVYRGDDQVTTTSKVPVTVR